MRACCGIAALWLALAPLSLAADAPPPSTIFHPDTAADTADTDDDLADADTADTDDDQTQSVATPVDIDIDTDDIASIDIETLLSEYGVPLIETPASPDAPPVDPQAIIASVQRLAAQRNAEAKKNMDARRYPRALALYKEAHALWPENPEFTNNLGHIYFLLGDMDEAEAHYREALQLDPERGAVYLNLADLLVERYPREPAPLAEAEALLKQARARMGNLARIIIRQARVSVRLADYPEAERHYRAYLRLKKPNDKLRLELGDFYQQLGRIDDALFWYRQVVGEAPGREAAQKIWDIELEQQNLQFGWTSGAAVIPDKAQKRAAQARESLRRNDVETAVRLLQDALSVSPAFAAAHADLGDLHARTGHPELAELAYLRALSFEPDNPEFLARLGKLYKGMRLRSTNAVIFLSRALDLRPQWTELHLQLAQAMRASGDLIGALEHVEAYLARVSGDASKREKALALKRSIDPLIPTDARGAARHLEADNPAIPAELSGALRAARLHVKHGNLDQAMAVLARIDPALRDTAVLNLEARIMLAAARPDAAIVALRRSLQQDETQPLVHQQLGQALAEMNDPDAARQHFLRAEALGDAVATFLIASLDAMPVIERAFSPGDIRSWSALRAAKMRLGQFLTSNAAAVFEEEATALLQQVRTRMRAIVIVYGIAFGLALALLIAILVRRLGGSDLRRLIAKHPEAGVHVQRILSAVRHEVLKHNTMMLSGLVTAMQDGEDVALRLARFEESFFGTGEENAVASRLQRYVDELEKIGHAHRCHLALARKDPALAPLMRGMHLVGQTRPQLSRYAQLSPAGRRRLLVKLRRAADLLNLHGYAAVCSLLDKLRHLDITARLLTDIYERCIREPAFAPVSFAPLHLEMPDGEPLAISVPRTSFEDILTNLIRNAVQSTLASAGEGAKPVAIGLSLDTEVDMVTGIERAVFQVWDQAAQSLTTEMLRGRYIEEGLGLTADLVTRYDGTLDVRPGEGAWSKAVIVKLPRADENVPGKGGA
ncbi:MAG: tetratricopeptide repeat protein [Myxococcales bacterium]|jgi:tetratricopeptide (TPR) repeat protein|nr:tetratricopeptide repeat protein [Myxococcales bacterium]